MMMKMIVMQVNAVTEVYKTKEERKREIHNLQ